MYCQSACRGHELKVTDYTEYAPDGRRKVYRYYCICGWTGEPSTAIHKKTRVNEFFAHLEDVRNSV